MRFMKKRYFKVEKKFSGHHCDGAEQASWSFDLCSDSGAVREHFWDVLFPAA